MGRCHVTKLKLRYVDRFTDRHGTVRHYFRRKGQPREVLPGLPGSAEFMAAYQKALRGLPTAASMTGEAPAGSFSALVVAYYQSTAFTRLAAVTKATYRNAIERLRKDVGDLPVVALQQHHIEKRMAKMAATPASANLMLKVLRILMTLAIKRGYRRDDPTVGIDRFAAKSDGFATWSPEDVEAFARRWPPGTRQHLAMSLLLWTGQRRGDVIRMGPQHIRQGRIELKQRKTGQVLAVPVAPELQASMDACPTTGLVFLLTEAGAPFTDAGFGNWFHDAVAAAGIKGKAAHGLRKATASRLAERGATVKQIQAVTGHRSLREIERYTRYADQLVQADAAINLLSAKPKP